MALKLFLDTNVFIDALAHREPFQQNAKLILALGILGEFELWMSATQATDVFYVLSEGGKASRTPWAKEQLKKLCQFVHACDFTSEDIAKFSCAEEGYSLGVDDDGNLTITHASEDRVYGGASGANWTDKVWGEEGNESFVSGDNAIFNRDGDQVRISFGRMHFFDKETTQAIRKDGKAK